MSPPAAARSPVAALAAHVQRAAQAVREHERPGEGASGVAAEIERPKREGQGDYSTNVAMLLAPALGAAPRVIAERLGEELTGSLGEMIDRVEVAGPGFLNLFVSDAWLRDALSSMLAAGERFGAGAASPPERILIEFVSANPTGPLVAASGRYAAYGDSLARILEHHGHEVSREYYVNDAGSQIRLLGESVQARARGEEVPEGGYQGDYVRDLAAEIPEVGSLSAEQAAEEAVARMLTRIQASLERYRVSFDRFFSERTLFEGSPSDVDRALERVSAGGHTYESEGALWLRTTDFGDDKDRVLRRSTGEPTYFTSDIGYLLNKLERGYDRQLMPLGADHHGYVARLKAAFAALGADPARLEITLGQFVHLVEGGERSAMSKRRGAFVTLDDLLEEIGVDATRFFMLQRSQDRTLDLDVGLAKQQSAENPVYYVQYAHARIASMLRRLGEERVAAALAPGAPWEEAALEGAERTLIKKLAGFPGEVAEAAERRAPHRITSYALELAQDFTAFYRDCRVVGATPESLESWRIALSVAARRVIGLSLGLLGVSAPEQM